MKKIVILLTVAILIGVTSYCFAAQSKTITVSATVSTISGGMDVSVTKIRASDDYWETTGDIPIAFGSLTYDSTYHIFRAAYYYAVEVGVNDNTGTAWTLTHTRTSIAKDATNNLDNNTNVTFMKQTTATSGTQLLKTSYTSSNNVAYTKAQLSGSWLRIYYGIATGQGDATGVTPIGVEKSAGSYSGSVTITLTP